MIVAGRVSQKMAPVLRQIYDQMAEPKLGALDGRLRLQRRHVQQLRDRAGRRPHRAGRHVPARLPAAARDAHRRDPQAAREDHGTSRSAPNGRKMLEARQAERGDVPVVAPGAMPSSYRVDKARRAEWTKAVREGREEQLRIENWMKPTSRHLREECAGDAATARTTAGVPVGAPPVGATSGAPGRAAAGQPGRAGHVRHPGHRRHLRLRRPGPPARRPVGQPRARTAATSTRSSTRWRRPTRASTTRSRRSSSTGAS